MRPPGRSTPLPLATIYILAFLLLNTAQRHVTTFAESTSSSAISFKALATEVTTPAVPSGTHANPSSTSTTTTTSTHATASSTLTTTISKVVAQPMPTTSTEPLPRRCKECPPNNTQGLTCYKNTQCVPLSLLCNTTTTPTTNITTGTNPCMDTTGPASTDDPIACQDQLCYAEDFLPLPSPGSGKVDRNSSINCMNGSYFSLYGTPAASGGTARYTQSCVAQFSAGQTASCSKWEYLAQSSCLLSTCGPGMDCEPPFKCRISSTSSAAQLYGICMNPSSTADPGSDDGDQDHSAKEHLILGLLIGLALVAGIGAGFWHFRKRRLRRLWIQSGERMYDREKISLLSTLKVYFNSCFFFGRGSSRQRTDGGDIGAATARGTRDARVVSLAESDSPEDSLVTDHQSNLIFARRWRWGRGWHAGAGAGVTEGGVAVLAEIDPPPLYHQGPELPSYRDHNTILLTPVEPGQSHTVDHSESEGRARLPIPK